MSSQTSIFRRALMAVFVAINVLPAFSAGDADYKCFTDPKPEVMNTALACIGKIGITNLDYHNMQATNYEDKCLAQCFFTSMKLFDDNGEAIESAMVSQVQAITPAALQEKATAGVKSCITSAKEKIAKFGTIKDANCKYAAMLTECGAKLGMELCKA